MWDRFPPQMRKAISTALELAGQSGAAEASTEHLLQAIAADEQCAAHFMLQQAGIAPAQFLETRPTSAITPEANNTSRQRAAKFSSAAMHVLDVAVAEAERRNDHHVGTEHVALSLTHTNHTPAAELLQRHGFTHDRATAALGQWQGESARRCGKRFTFASRALDRVSQPFGPITKAVRLGWNVYIGKSLGHPKFVSDPYPLYRALRRRAPVRKDPIAPVWVITSHAETMTMLRDPRFKKDPFAAQRLPPIVRAQLRVPDSAAGRAAAEMVSMLFLDPPEHTRVRTIFTKAFTPRRLEVMRTRIELITQKLLDSADRAARDNRGRFDLIRELAYPLPVVVIAEMLGFPPEDYERIKRWSDEMADALGLNPSLEQQSRAYKARMEIRAYFEQIVARLKQTPRENLISTLLSGEAYGDRGERLNPDEMFSNCILLLAAGHETTTNLIGNGMLALLRNPRQLAMLREDLGGRIDSAVDELLRYDPPVQWTSRVTGETLALGGQTIERGAILLASLGAANRDPAVFERPETFDILRADAGKQIAFGAGPHFCLGAALARMEARAAISALVTCYPNLRLARQCLRWRKGLTFRGPHEIWLHAL